MAEMEEPSKRWQILMEMDRFDEKAQEEDQGALALVLDLAKAFERVSLPVVWAWATHFSFPRKILRVPCGYFEHQRRVQMCGGAAPDHNRHLPGSKWSCLLLLDNKVIIREVEGFWWMTSWHS